MNIQACEELATKAELQELKEQINNLLGKPENGSEPIDVLSQGNLDNTAIASRLVEDIELTQDKETGEIQAAFLVGSPGGVGGSGVKLKKLLTSGFELLTAPARFQVAVATTTLGLLSSSKKREELNEQIGKNLADFIDKNETARNTEIKLRDIVNNGSSLLDVLDKAPDLLIAKENVDLHQNQIEQLKQENLVVKDNLELQIADISDLLNNEILVDSNSLYLEKRLNNLAQEINNNSYTDNTTRKAFIDAVNGLQQQIQIENDRTEELENTVTNFKDRIAQTEQELADSEARYDDLIAEQQSYKDRIIELEQWIADPTNYLTDSYVAPTDPPNTTTTTYPGSSNTPNQTTTTTYLPVPTTSEDVIKNTAKAGNKGGIPASVKNSIPDLQNRLIDLSSHLANNPDTVVNPNTGIETLVTSDITYQDVVLGESPFTNIMDGLIPAISTNTSTNTNTNTSSNTNTNTQTQDNNVNQQELNDSLTNFQTNISDDIETIISAIVANQIAPPLTNIQNNTTKDAISSAASEAICNQANNPSSCLNAKIKNPLQNSFNKGLNDLFNKINALLNTALLAQGKAILNIVKDTNTVLKNSLLGSVADKVLNALNTALLVHNAAMLSNQIGETIRDIASLVLNSVGIKDTNGNDIDVNGILKTKLESLIKSFIGQANYQALTLKLAATNRIYQAGQNIVNDVTDLFDATHQVLEQTGSNVAKIGNSLRDAGAINFDAYDEMNEEIKANSKVFKRLEGLENATDSVYSIVSDIQDIKDTSQSIIENREEFDEALKEFKDEANKQQADRETAIENLE